MANCNGLLTRTSLLVREFESHRLRPLSLKLQRACAMYYVYIIRSSKSGKVYTGWTNDLRKRLKSHNSGENRATKSGAPWKVIFYSAFNTEKLAKDFERYLKTGSGIAFARKRLFEVLVKEDEV